MDRDPAGRDAFLREACAGDDGLRREIESLLGYDGATNPWIERPAAVVAAPMLNTSASSAVLTGRQIGPYQIGALLGAGGMGEVYRARDSKLGRDVAIKILPPHLTDDPQRRARFAREARLLATVNHPHVGAIYGLEEGDGVTGLILELVDGPTLADLLAEGPLALGDALPLAHQIAEALEAAHEKGIVHRDLKPGNILLQRVSETGSVTSDLRVKVVDFGLAKPILVVDAGGQTEAEAGSVEGRLLGTPAYMSPEQARGKAVDKRTDIWAFGCVLYEMLTGQRAFAGDDVSDTLANVMRAEPAWAKLPDSVPPALTTFLKRCLRKNPSERVRDIGDVRLALEGAFDTVVSSGPPAGLLTRERLSWLSALLVLILLAAGALMWARRSAPRVPEMRLEITTPPAVDLTAFALSPDGRRLVYAAGVGEQPRLWLRVLADGTSRPLEGTEGASAPFWSPDSLSVGFFSGGQLKILDVAGRSVRPIARAAGGLGGAWNRDNVIVYAPSGVTGLFRVSSDGGPPQPATTLRPSQRAHSSPQFLPDGRRFLFFAAGPPETRGVYVGELDSSEITRLVDADAGGVFGAPDRLLFARQTRLFAQHFSPDRLDVTGGPEVIAEQVATGSNGWRAAVAADDAGMIAYRASGGPSERRYIWFDRSGNELGPVSDSDVGNTPNLGGPPALSPDQGRLAFSRIVDGNNDVWILEIARGFLTQFTSNPAVEGHPLWSPDGKRIVFTRVAEGLYIKDADGESPEQLVLRNSGATTATDWSRDGQFVLYKSGQSRPVPLQERASWDILALRIDGDRSPFPVAQTAADERDGQFSHDGKWVAYQSDDGGEVAIWVQPFQRQGKKERISPGSGAQPRWRADGKEIFYLTLDGQLMSVPIEFDPAGETITPGTPVPLFKTRVVSVVLAAGRQQYTPSPDGQRFLVHTITGEVTTPPITVILNKGAAAAPSRN